MSPKGQEVRVGLLILVAIVVLTGGIFVLGSKKNLFKHKTHYYTELSSVSGLKRNSPVQLDGVDVGTIERVILSEDPRKTEIRVWIRLDEEYEARIRGPLDPTAVQKGLVPSRVRIKTIGLLGDKYIDINSGSAAYPPIPEDGKIPAAPPTNVDALFASGEDVMDNVVEITHSLNTILSRMEKGQGLLGQLTSDSPEGRRLLDSLTSAADSLNRITSQVENGKGLIPRLLNDRAMGDQLAQSLDRFQNLLDQAQHGPGILPGLINDPAARTELNDTLASLHQVSKDLQGFTAGLDSSDALLPRLVKDKEYGREITEQIRQMVKSLNEVSAKLDRGNGSAAKLINDPKIYDAVNDIVVGVNQSRTLRWLLRNRQKKGIDKRYEDTRKAIEESGGTPEPLDPGPDDDKAPPAGGPSPPQAPPPADLTSRPPAPSPPPPNES
ncbi:MAG TPA: MlaD family protein [Thermoanaerobaculia bacterium]|jgi:phospholipid/cholesterol/gamma-HCH transport system substrate-binding protein|nr:MlaD family protein [Thermoanaerobaculia bacterium]